MTRHHMIVGLVVAAGAAVLPGCIDFGYLLPALRGQLHIVDAAEAVDDVLARGALAAEELDKLALMRSARRFARNTMGLYTRGQFDTFYDAGGAPVAFNLSVAPDDALEPYEWWFPIIGKVPYLAFFTRQAATARARPLQAENHDTFIYELDAYNASNFFSNPILSPVLQRDEADLANVVIHELLHSTVWAPNNTDFNESLATFVGRAGALDFFATEYADDPGRAAHARALFADVDVLEAFIRDLTGRLVAAYALDIPRGDKLMRRQDIVDQAIAEFEDRARTTLNDPALFDWIPEMTPNNAFLLGFRRYSLDLEVFAAVHDANGRIWPASIDVFRAASNEPDPYAFLEQWLQNRAPLTHTATDRPTRRGPCACHAAHTLFEDAGIE